MRKIEIKMISITDLKTDAIVNAANSGLWAGGGVCGAIFKAAGYKDLENACKKIGHCDTGNAVITPGFASNAKYIIHAVGPQWKGGNHNEPELLYKAYQRSLELAVQNNCHSIGFPLISAGIYGYPMEKAWEQAIRACCDFLKQHNADLYIVFAVLDKKTFSVGNECLNELGSAIKVAVKDDWKTLEMPKEHDEFVLKRSFSKKQIEILRCGHVPQEMEDKWFWYFENGKLYAYRSWTGYCIYIIEFSSDDNHRVTVNRCDEQCTCKSADEDIATLNSLLDWWCQPEYDYYNEWLQETAAAISKSAKKFDKLKIGDQTVDAVFFHKPEEPHGYLSNWYHSPFDLDGMHFTSTEQYIMYRKCMAFGDEKSAAAVMKTADPAKQQEIGRCAKNYIDSVWKAMRQSVATVGLLEKFRQNEELRNKLLDTGDAYLVECARLDKAWACGRGLDEEERFDASLWTGSNILGFALMEVRNMIRSEYNQE